MPCRLARFVDRWDSRTFYSDGDRQFVIDDDVKKVFGVWIIPEEDQVDIPLVSEQTR
jgi:hypothetical protein